MSLVPISSGGGERSLERTMLFEAGITAARIDQVVRILPELLWRMGKRPHQAPIAWHQRNTPMPNDHYGWLVRGAMEWQPTMLEGGVVPVTGRRMYTVILPDTSGTTDKLTVCTGMPNPGESPARDFWLDIATIEEHDRLFYGAPQGSLSVPERAQLFHVNKVGEMVTKFVETYGLLEAAYPFATQDPPVPGND